MPDLCQIVGCGRTAAMEVLLVAAALGALSGCRVAAPAAGRTTLMPALVHPRSTTRAAWAEWGEAHLQTGDVLFVLGDSRILLGLVNFSQLSSRLADSPFSHVALVSRENGQLLVYDTVDEGPRRTPWEDFIADRRLSRWAVKRPLAEYGGQLPATVAYCRQAWQQGIPFDEQFRLDNEALYCSELVELAFRQAGLNLSEPVPINRLPGYARIPASTRRLVLSATACEPQQPVYVPGNDSLGLWSSPLLELVLDTASLNLPPGSEADETSSILF